MADTATADLTALAGTAVADTDTIPIADANRLLLGISDIVFDLQ